MEKELLKIVNYLNSNMAEYERKEITELEEIVQRVMDDYKNSSFDFSNMKSITLNQMGKKRSVRMYDPFTTEEILCVYIKRLIDRKTHVKYPNRNVFMCSLFDIIASLKDMTEFTVFKFDFKDFFNSVSSKYVYEKQLSSIEFEREHKNLIAKFCGESKYTYAGLNTSNVLCELIAKEFDKLVEVELYDRGLIYYKRYIDDSVLVFNTHIRETECNSIISKIINKVFYDRNCSSHKYCKVKINETKTKYISKNDLVTSGNTDTFDFLGYLFTISVDPSNKKTIFKYGITEEKINKYSKRIDGMIREFKENAGTDIELLRHRIKAFASRTVYTTNRFNQKIWKTKGFISNYAELRNRSENLDEKTRTFLIEGIKESFNRLGVDLPYFMKTTTAESAYSLYNNLIKNKTILLVEHLGTDYETLKKQCKKIGIENTEGREYDSLVREYLIKVKVGH